MPRTKPNYGAEYPGIDLTMEEGQVTPISWQKPHPLFVMVLVGPDEVPFGIQKDLLVAKSPYFRTRLSGVANTLEEVERMPDTDTETFGFFQSFIYTGSMWAKNQEDQKVPGYAELLRVWKLASSLDMASLRVEVLNAMADRRQSTSSIPDRGLLMRAWEETEEGSGLRIMLIGWAAEYMHSSPENRGDFAKSLPQDILSELVVAMSNTPKVPSVASPANPTLFAPPFITANTLPHQSNAPTADAGGHPRSHPQFFSGPPPPQPHAPQPHSYYHDIQSSPYSVSQLQSRAHNGLPGLPSNRQPNMQNGSHTLPSNMPANNMPHGPPILHSNDQSVTHNNTHGLPSTTHPNSINNGNPPPVSQSNGQSVMYNGPQVSLAPSQVTNTQTNLRVEPSLPDPIMYTAPKFNPVNATPSTNTNHSTDASLSGYSTNVNHSGYPVKRSRKSTGNIDDDEDDDYSVRSPASKKPRKSDPGIRRPRAIQTPNGWGPLDTPDKELEFCKDIMARMVRGSGYWSRFVRPFKSPVDPVADNVPDYYEVIKNPMDLTTIKNKLWSGAYTNGSEFEQDVRLIHKNCFEYWSEEDPMWKKCEDFEKHFNSQWAERYKWRPGQKQVGRPATKMEVMDD